MIKKILRKYIAITPQQKARKQFYAVKLEKIDITIDCGANVGNITDHLARSGATVYAFEPNPHAFKLLQERFSAAENVHCIPKGVSDQNDKMKLYMHKKSTEDEIHWSVGSSLLAYKGNVRTDKYVKVDIIDLCAFIASLNQRVKLLKLDVEGVECQILNKLVDTNIVDQIDHIFVETHDHRIPELKAETDDLRTLIKSKGITHINLDWM